MAGQGSPLLLLACLLLPGLRLCQGAKLLTLSFLGGSHFLLMDEISQLLQEHGHEVRMLQQEGLTLIPGLKSKRSGTYQITTWSSSEDYKRKYLKDFEDYQEDFLQGRNYFSRFLEFMGHLATQCSFILNNSDVLDFLKNQKLDLLVLDAFDPCTFLIAEKIGRPSVAILSTSFNYLPVWHPSPLSYVPVQHSSLTDRMGFWGRVKNCLMFLSFPVTQRQIQAQFDEVIKEHFPSGARPSLPDLYRKPELWMVNSDFSFEFTQPLLPNTVYIGGLMAKPGKPLPQEFEDFIASSGEAGFILVTLGSMVASFRVLEVMKEMNAGFALLPQAVIWRFQLSQWPKEVPLATNVKIVEWLPQNDLLAHPKAKLLVTHGGINSVMEAIHHGVPMVGIPLFGDQFDNMVRVEAKTLGVTVPVTQLKAEMFAHTMKRVIEDRRYKSSAVAASTIRRSHPFPPAQRLVGWIDHILQTGGGDHLRPFAFQQPWYEQYMLDVISFLVALTLASGFLCVMLGRVARRRLCGLRKLKQT
ncbi:UDP-glucuronosyltransferase 3A2-like [Ornithorhynchus anatinus]|nr:UDP-glucuronosyltransferase 3A2-like [Ornithorhynchus anatinus]